MDSIIKQWQELIRNAVTEKKLLRLRGGGTKDFYSQELHGELFDTRAYRGIVNYQPTELVITARCGTPLSEIEQTMREQGQMLAFEPPHFGDSATLGGCVASGLSGPRRAYAGAVRDLVLGVRLLDGNAALLRFGGQVIKNVAGFDAARLMVGAMGTLGLLLEVSIKAMPLPETEVTLLFEFPPEQAIQQINQWSGQPWPISASCYEKKTELHGLLAVRLSGSANAIRAARAALGGEQLDDSQWWIYLREQQHPFFRQDETPLWRLSVNPTAPYTDLGGPQLLEWGGALRWLKTSGEPEQIRAWTEQHGGHATLFRTQDKRCGVFHPLPAPLRMIQQNLKQTFDPNGIFNQGRIYPVSA